MNEERPDQARVRALNPAPLHYERTVPKTGLVIGRDPEQADHLISARRVSRRHCWIGREKGHWIVLDLNSTNGVFVDGQRISGQHPILPGQVIGLGCADPPDFEFILGDHARNRFILPPAHRWQIGRTLDADIALPADPTISERHGEILQTENGLEIVDLASLNGIRVDGRRVGRRRPYKLGDRATVDVGNTRLELQSVEGGGLEVIVEGRSPGPQIEADGISAPEIGLDRFTGTMQPGQIIGLVSDSPDRATGLLEILAGRRRPASGRVRFGENPRDETGRISQHRIGFVEHEETLDGTLTVWQHLKYAAELRLPPDFDARRRESLLATTMTQLGLAPFRNKRLAALKPAQRRLAAIAGEMITRPAVLGLDHPFSELDADQAGQVIEQLRYLARTGTIVLIAGIEAPERQRLDQLVDIDEPQSPTETTTEPAPASGLDAGSGLNPIVSRRRISTLFRRQCRIRLNDTGMIAIYLLMPILLAMAATELMPQADLELALFLVAMAAAVFTAAPEIGADRARLRHEFHAGVPPGEDLLARLVFCWMIGIVQVLVITAIIGLQADIPAADWGHTVATLILVAWAASALGLMIGTLDPTRARLVMPVAVALIVIQWIVMTASAPEHTVIAWLFARVRDLMPAYWGMTLSGHLQEGLADNIRPALRALAFLIGQMITWMIVARGLLRRQLRAS